MNSESNKEYSVNWKNHMSHVRKAFDHLLSSNELTDVTLCCEGKKIGAHKMLLSACSTYFRDTFKDVPCQHPVIILYGIEHSVLSDILQFIYKGEVSVDTAKLDLFLKTAQLLQISGLTDDPSDKLSSQNEQNVQAPSSEQRIEEAYAEPITYPTTTCEDTKKGVKRTRSKETEVVKDKVQRQEDETLFVSDVKCEPSEIVSFEDPLEDPLLQSEQSNDTREFFGTATTQEEDEFKTIVDELLTKEENINETEASRSNSTLIRHHIFHKLPGGSRIGRKYCRGCYKKKTKNLTPKSRVKKVTTCCLDCPGQPRYCLDCFTIEHHS